MTVSTYIQRSNQTVKYLVIDVDISKRHFLQMEEKEALNKYLPEAAKTTGQILKFLSQMGIQSYLESSGFRGFHIWIFFTEWIPSRYVVLLVDQLEEKIQLDNDDVTVEYFPNKSRVKNGSPGLAVKLPPGISYSYRKTLLYVGSKF